MEIRPYTKLDYVRLESWWKGHKWTPLHSDCLPETGFIVNNICAGFLYKTDSNIAILEFVIADPESDKKERDKALDCLFDTLINTAKEMGFHNIMGWLNHPSLVKRYEKFGFGITHSDVIEVARRL